MSESFAELFEQSQAFAKLKPGAIVTGVVVDVKADVVIVNAGLKSEGVIPIEQFRDDDGELEINIGDEVQVALEYIENGFGECDLRTFQEVSPSLFKLAHACRTRAFEGAGTDRSRRAE